MRRSLRESRAKHMVTTSFSSAPLQMGRLYLRQKARLHCEQLDDAARLSSMCERGAAAVSPASPLSLSLFVASDGVAVVVVVVGLGAGGGAGGGSWPGPNGMMVLFLKQVHLQNVGGAVSVLSVWSAFW